MSQYKKISVLWVQPATPKPQLAYAATVSHKIPPLPWQRDGDGGEEWMPFPKKRMHFCTALSRADSALRMLEFCQFVCCISILA